MALPGVNCRRGRKADGYDVCWMLERLVCGLALTAMLFAWQPASWQAEGKEDRKDCVQAQNPTLLCGHKSRLARRIVPPNHVFIHSLMFRGIHVHDNCTV